MHPDYLFTDFTVNSSLASLSRFFNLKDLLERRGTTPGYLVFRCNCNGGGLKSSCETRFEECVLHDWGYEIADVIMRKIV